MAQFMHPNIVRVFGSVDKGNTLLYEWLVVCVVMLASLSMLT